LKERLAELNAGVTKFSTMLSSEEPDIVGCSLHFLRMKNLLFQMKKLQYSTNYTIKKDFKELNNVPTKKNEVPQLPLIVQYAKRLLEAFAL